MNNPYFIEPPASINFSGGRSSGFMLHNIIEAHQGDLPEGIEVVFCNTGLEHKATYDFIHEFSEQYKIKINWIEYHLDEDQKQTFKVVDYGSASRSGEPFSLLNNKYERLPNPVQRYCTGKLKIITNRLFLKSFKWSAWDACIGLRADEQRRVNKYNAEVKYETPIFPMYEAGHDQNDVNAFWKKNAFDLKLPHDSNIWGNCVGCHLKGIDKLYSIAEEDPSQLQWWADQENLHQNRFRKDRPSYEKIIQGAKNQGSFNFVEEDTIPCFCTD
jgi:3'-phosphoadenosine 5'-phosphosulfate sulfotransferase (PAPS reductase)/FAD synthetase